MGRRSRQHRKMRLQARRPACRTAQGVAAGNGRLPCARAAATFRLPHVLPSIAGERTEYTMRQNSFLSISILLALSGVAQAADDRAALQPTVEVTASRVAETADASLADVSIVTRADIEASVAPDLLELLRLQAGVDVVRTGGAGEQTSV